jgi:hypothetical protein
LLTPTEEQFVHGKVQNTFPSRQRIRSKKLCTFAFRVSKVPESERIVCPGARSVFDHDRIAATKRIRRFLGYGTGLEHEDIAFHQWKIEIFGVGLL